MRDADGLTPRQKAWCDEYIKSGNGIDAARNAGYSKPKQSSDDNRENPACIAYIAARMQPTAEKRIASADEVLGFLSRVVRGEEKDQFGLDSSLQDRIKAAQELLKRYAVAEAADTGACKQVDIMLAAIMARIEAEPEPPTSSDGAAAQQPEPEPEPV